MPFQTGISENIQIGQQDRICKAFMIPYKFLTINHFILYWSFSVNWDQDFVRKEILYSI